MKRRPTPEQIIAKLPEPELAPSKGHPIARIVRKLGISEQTYCRWRKEYGGLRSDQAKRLKQLEQENARLKKVVADLTLDNAILKEVADPNFFRRHVVVGVRLVASCLPCPQRDRPLTMSGINGHPRSRPWTFSRRSRDGTATVARIGIRPSRGTI